MSGGEGKDTFLTGVLHPGMGYRGEDRGPGCSWIPTTPVKPGSERQQLICPNWNENQYFQANSLESGKVTEANLQESRRSLGDFLAESPFRNVPVYSSSNSDSVSRGLSPWQAGGTVNSEVYSEVLCNFDTWQADKAGSSRVYGEDKLPTNDADQWANMSFSDLLALADANANCSSSGNYSAQNTYIVQGGRFHGESNSIPHTHWGGTSFHSGPSFYGNSLDGSFKYAAMTPSQFEPITPDKTRNLEHRQDSTAMLEFSLYTGHAAIQAQAKTITREVMEHDEKNEESNVASSQLCETMPGELQENHKPDKEGTEEADLSKTPQQKSRRKKHRPKVIIEGKSKGTPKSRPETPLVPQENTGVKRKYVRRKGVNTPINANGNDSNTKAATAKDTPVSKKKCTMGKVIDKPEATTEMGDTATVDQMTGRGARKSCRRALNFDSEYQVRDESSACNLSSTCEMQSRAEHVSGEDQSRTLESRQGKEIILEKNGTEITRGTTSSIDQELNNCQSRPERRSAISFSPEKADYLQNEFRPTGKNVSVKGKCQIVFSDATNDKEVNILQLSLDTRRQWTPNSSSDYNNSSRSLSTPERQPRDLKRHVDTIAEAEEYSKDATEKLHFSIPNNHFVLPKFTERSSSTSGMCFPALYKRNRTQTAFNTTLNLQCNNVKVGRGVDSFPQVLPSSKQGPSIQYQASSKIMGNANGAQDGQQVFKELLALGPSERVRKKQSKAPAGAGGVSLQGEMSVSAAKDTKTSKRGRKIGQDKHTMALTADTSSPMMTKGQLDGSLTMNSIVKYGFNHLELPSTSRETPLALPWMCTSQIDAIVGQLSQLNLNAETSRVSAQNYVASVVHYMHYQEHSAIIPYQRGGAVVPFDSSFEQVRRRKPRPKVDLDDETARVWKLLLENINSEGINGTDKENAKWWEEERRVFNGRADSFIARMHLVQGDRRFSPWKGSVVDSVVGVFLTQNVSDHLSSSAFMSLAARFPLEEKTIPEELHEASMGTGIKEPEVCVLDPKETVGSNRGILLEPVTPGGNCIGGGDEEIRVVTSVNSIGNNSDIVQKESLRCQLLDVSQCDPIFSHESASNKSTSLNRDRLDTEEAVSSQTSVISSQNSADSPIAQTERTESSPPGYSGEEPQTNLQPDRFNNSSSFVKLRQLAGTVIHGVYRKCSDKEDSKSPKALVESSPINSQAQSSLNSSAFALEANLCSQSAILVEPNSDAEGLELPRNNDQCSDTSIRELQTAEISGLSVESTSKAAMKFTSFSSKGLSSSRPNENSTNKDNIGTTPKISGKQIGPEPSLDQFQGKKSTMHDITDIEICPQNLMDATASSSNVDILRKSEINEVNSKNGPVYCPGETVNGPKTKGVKTGKDKQDPVDWDGLRKQALKDGCKRERTANTMDSVDWEAVRRADVREVADAVKERGMNNKLAERIKDFLDRIVTDHGSINLEWLRDVPPDKAKEYLLSVRGLGLKSVECVRLLTLHQLAFPVDTNVGRIAVRLGWVPLQPLPESLQLHLLELYPVLESIQKYLWPRLCKLDQRTLYELHYQMITFGKVFCTKNKPNCNACPMKGECRHFASAFASARLALPAPEDKSIVSATENKSAGQNTPRAVDVLQLPSPQANHADVESGVSKSLPIIEEPKPLEPIIEEPASPEQDFKQISERDIEDAFYEDPEEIPTIQLNMEQFTHNLQKVLEQNTELQECNMSNALVALTAEAASIPVPKLKSVSQLRTEHQVYELPDSHPLLHGVEKREPDDPSPYLLAIWTPGETIDSINPPERRCSSQGSEILCTDETCLSCNSIREVNAKTVRGTLLIPCRTAMRGSFPLNGTYFQVNEMFSDHESSLEPIDVPREWLWNLRRRIVYFGTSVPTIFKGLTTEQIQYCFWRGFVCVRGFDRNARAPRPLVARLHFPASKRAKAKGKTAEN